MFQRASSFFAFTGRQGRPRRTIGDSTCFSSSWVAPRPTTARRRLFLSTSSTTSTTTSSGDDPKQLVRSILERVERGTLTAEEATMLLSTSTTLSDEEAAVSQFANLDHRRARRTGFPEAVFAAGKTPHQIASILDSMASHVNAEITAAAMAKTGDETCEEEEEDDIPRAILATRVDKALYREVASIPLQHGEITYHETARIISMRASAEEEIIVDGDDREQQPKKDGGAHGGRKKVIIACAGTTDLPVAEEAAITLSSANVPVERIYDVGVAGLHRIINALPKLRDPSVGCIIVCAGMDGALPSVVGGLVGVPVIAVPTSVGYGACFGGVSALLTMLNSCAPGVGVVNIDNGFGAAALAFKCITPPPSGMQR